MNQSISTETMMSNNIKTDEENKEKKYNNIDWDHIEKDVVLRMQKILKENGNPDPNTFDDEEYKRLRDEILVTLCPFTYKKEEFIDKEEKKASDNPEIPDDYKTYNKIHVTSCDKTPFAKLLIDKIHKMGFYEDDMLSVKENLMDEAYGEIVEKALEYNRFYKPDKETSFMTYIVTKCYFVMLHKFTDDYGQKKGNKTIYHDSLDKEIYEGGPTLLETLSSEDIGVDPINEAFETDNTIRPFSKEEFNEVFPSDYFLPEEKAIIKILTKENNDKYNIITKHIHKWKETHPLNDDNYCEYTYDLVIDYICNKGNLNDLGEFLSNRTFLLNKLKTFGLESPEHNPYTADYIYSTFMRIKRKRDRLKNLKH